jgi:hypothetical protein
MPLNNYTHLPLPLVTRGKLRRTGGGSESEAIKHNKTNRGQHSQALIGSAQRISASRKQSLADREEPKPHSLPAGIPLILETEPDIDLDFLRSAFDFEVIAEGEDGFILVASVDIDLTEFIAKAQAFANAEHGSGAAAKVYRLVEEGDDRKARLERILSERLLTAWPAISELTVLVVDISIACIGSARVPEVRDRRRAETDEEFELRLVRYREKLHDRAPQAKPPKMPVRRLEEPPHKYAEWLQGYRQQLRDWWAEFDHIMLEREGEIAEWVEAYGGSIIKQTNAPEFPDSFVVRASITFKGLRDIVYNHPHLFEVAEVDEIDVLEGNQPSSDRLVYPTLLDPHPDTPLVAIVDSGIQEDHPLLAPSVERALSISYVPGDVGVADMVSPSGHGTRVSGAALYRNGVMPGAYRLPFRVANIRVLDKNASLSENLVAQDYIGKAVGHLALLADVKIFNHSISSKTAFRKTHMSAWAASLDVISYEKDVLFVQAAGNLQINDPLRPSRSINRLLLDGSTYPAYLLTDGCRIANPGQSFQALTVGSISQSEWEVASRRSMGAKYQPSGFTSTGPGIWQSIKPDVVEIGGCLSIDGGAPPTAAPHHLSSVDLVRATITPGELKSQDAFGTSFAVPRVTGLLAEIQQLLPDEPALLYRALAANAARWPEWAENYGEPGHILRFLGYGVPSDERALGNTNHRVTLITNGVSEIGGSEAHIYRVPIPVELRKPSDDSFVRLDVTLSYAARPRRTRRNPRGYLSTWLDWKSSCMQESFNSFAARIVQELDGMAENDAGEQIGWMLRERAGWGQVAEARRSVGTLQKDWAFLHAHELPADLCIAIRGHKGWDKNSEDKAKYALAVSIESLGNELVVYSPIETAIHSLVEIPAVEVDS